MVSFTDLATNFLNNSTQQEIWGYRMPGAPPDAYQYLLNRTGCEALRGTGSDYYDWADAANTLNTWVLPFTGLLLQAPFDSNNAKGTLWAVTRWVGGPMASLSYVGRNYTFAENEADTIIARSCGTCAPRLIVQHS